MRISERLFHRREFISGRVMTKTKCHDIDEMIVFTSVTRPLHIV